MLLLLWASLLPAACWACSDFYMNFTDPNLRLSVRTMDLGLMQNWTITAWPTSDRSFVHKLIDWEPKYSTLGFSANWFGDEHYGFPTFFGDGLNEAGLSCSLQTLVDTQYEERGSLGKDVFAGVFCHWVLQSFATVDELQVALQDVAIWGPDILAQHFAVRDANGMSLVIECVNGHKSLYLDKNDGTETFGIMTNEPTFDYHLMNIKHYEWKRTLARQAVAIPGNFYPEERYLRIHMVKSGMQTVMESTTNYQQAISLAVQVLNTITVPMGEGQYGTDSGETSGEGEGDHTVIGIVRDHANKIVYWRDATNPSLRRLRLADVLPAGDRNAKRTSVKLETGPYFFDMANEMK